MRQEQIESLGKEVRGAFEQGLVLDLSFPICWITFAFFLNNLFFPWFLNMLQPLSSLSGIQTGQCVAGLRTVLPPE
jgi:hypothetical protein